MSSPVTLIDSKIDEAHRLLSATHDYIKWQAPKDMNTMDPHITFILSSEAMRVTVRLTQIIAWLMLQKAILEEELTLEDTLSESCRVIQGEECLDQSSEEDKDIPPRLRELLKESRIFYFSILRLDTRAREQHLPHRKRS
jgi:regulator of CtrA degradation